jgi:Flp pilus assembly protein TadG
MSKSRQPMTRRRLRARPAAGGVLRRIRSTTRGQALVETALIVPVLLLLLGGVADLGRAFYYKIAVTNTAREAAHWATLLDSFNAPPTDTEILAKVANPSQESFGINLSAAPSAVANQAPPLTPSVVAASLAPSSSSLFVYPGFSGRTSMLQSGQHWEVVATDTRVVTGPAPDHGGLARVLDGMAGPFPRDAYADQPSPAPANCYSWNNLLVSPTMLNVGPGTPYSGAVTASVQVTGNTGTGQADNSLSFTVTGPPSAGFSTTWKNNKPTDSLDPKVQTSDTASLARSTALAPGPYVYTVTAHSTSSLGCTQPDLVANFTINVTGPSPSPSPTPSPTPSATPSPSPTPSIGPSPTPGTGGSAPKGNRITCTVIYYFQPVTPLLFIPANAIYVVGTATLQATY